MHWSGYIFRRLINTYVLLVLIMQRVGLVSLENARQCENCKDRNSSSGRSKKPHIVFILADDIGWNDVSWHNPEMHMPTLNALARSGVIFDQYYTQATCTPSRAALHTGYYPYKFGFQRGKSSASTPYGLPSDMSKLPEKLRELGYRTHLVGKWHIGFCKEEYTPTRQGYDRFYGYYLGYHDNWYTHQASDTIDGELLGLNETLNGFDLRNMTLLAQDNSTFIDLLFRNTAVEYIKDMPEEQPMFLMFSTNLVHDPYQIPPTFMELFEDVEGEGRRIYSAMVAWMDESVAKIVEALKERGMWDNTLLVFAGDNGGMNEAAADNSPLRGGKDSLHEGGTRVPAFFHGRVLEKRGYTNQRLMHVVDWFNTLIHFAGGAIDTRLDSSDLWSSVVRDEVSRQEIVYNIDTMRPCLNKNGECAAIRIGNYKLFVGDYDVSTIPVMEYVRHAIKNQTLELYNLKDDPVEHNNLANRMELLVFHMLRKLKEYSLDVVPPLYNTEWNLPTADADPDNFGGAWSPGWC